VIDVAADAYKRKLTNLGAAFSLGRCFALDEIVAKGCKGKGMIN
jgi:hypothetical protein